jgi:hypothetical protein
MEEATRILITIENGVIQNICSTDFIEIKLLNLDNLNQGDTLECKNIYEPDVFIDKEDMDKIINAALENAKTPILTLAEAFEDVRQWGEKHEIIKPEYIPKQAMKVIEEIGELFQAIIKNKSEAEKADGVGDSFITLILLCHQLGLDPTACITGAMEEIRNRDVKLVDGTLIKKADR